MTDIRPFAQRPAEPLAAIRGDEVAILRDELAKAQAQITDLMGRAHTAEIGERYYRDLYRGALLAHRHVTRERDQARAHAQAIGEQQPVWEGP